MWGMRANLEWFCCLCATSGFEADPKTSKFEIHARAPKVDVLSNYKATAQLFGLPIIGHGRSNCSMGAKITRKFQMKLLIHWGVFFLVAENFECVFKLYPNVETRNGQEYVHFDKIKVTFTMTR